MRTLGVDLASSADRTAVCALDWAGGRAAVGRLETGADDDRIVALASDADAVGIDAPFGWPAPFVELVAGRAEAREWTTARRDELRFRATDRHVWEQTGRWPLSVSSDLIGVVAMRCHGLLQRLGVTNRIAHEKVVEVYPAAALRRWMRATPSYKGPQRQAERDQLVARLFEQAIWLHADEAAAELLRRSDDAFDALVASCVARAAKVGLADGPPADPRAPGEGWIVLPKEGSLAALAD